MYVFQRPKCPISKSNLIQFCSQWPICLLSVDVSAGVYNCSPGCCQHGMYVCNGSLITLESPEIAEVFDRSVLTC